MSTRAGVDAVAPLLAQLAQRAAGESEARLAAARAEAARIRDEGEARRRTRRDEALARTEAETWRCGQPEIARATRESRQRVLRARRDLVDRVLDAARAVLAERAAGSVPPADWLRARVDEVLSFTSGSVVELRCPAGWVESARAVAAGRPGVSVVADPGAASGLRAVDAESRLTVDDTADSWLRREHAALAIEICRAVEPEGA